jgi:hypothetical protein
VLSAPRRSPKATRQARRRYGGYPTDSSTLFLCSLSHNPTLQPYRLPSVTANVTRRTFWSDSFRSD